MVFCVVYCVVFDGENCGVVLVMCLCSVMFFLFLVVYGGRMLLCSCVCRLF